MPPFDAAPGDPRMMIEALSALGGSSGALAMPGGPGAAPGASAPGVDPRLLRIQALGLSALDRVLQRDPSGELALEQIRRALELSQTLLAAVLPMVTAWNPKVAKDLHVIGRQIADARMNLSKEDEPGPPPEAMMSGMPANTGIPGGPAALG